MNSTRPSAPLDARSPAAAADADQGQPLGPRTRRLGWVGALVLLVMLLLFAGWAAMAPLDEGVPVPAQVSIDTKRKAVQHLQGGIIRQVLVREGQVVKEGDVLIQLDDVATRANHEAVRQHYLSFRAEESRLTAEQLGRDRIDWHPDLLQAAQDPRIQQYMAAQQQVFQTRRIALGADTQAMQEAMRGFEAQIQAYGGMIQAREQQRALMQEQLGRLKGLVAEGYAPRNQQLELERQMADLNAAIIDLQGNVVRARQQIAETRQRLISRRQDYRKETDTQLAEASREAQSDEGKLRALADELTRTVIRAPSRGQVVGLAFQTVGGVIPPGQKLMDIVPEEQELLLEAKVPPNLIDQVRPGLATDVRFSTFPQAPQLVVPGEVVSVSGDVLVEQTPQGATVSYFLGRIRVTPEGMRKLGQHQMQAGMPAEVIIVTGERTLLTYLLHPLLRRVAASMKEH